MEALQSISELIISSDKINYNKKSKVLAIDLPGFTFIGNYSKNTRISVILNDISKVLEEKGIKIAREDIHFFDADIQQNIHGNTKLNKLMKKQKPKELKLKEQDEKKEIKQTAKAKTKKRERMAKPAPKVVAEPSILPSEIAMEPEEIEEEKMEESYDKSSLLDAEGAPETGGMLKDSVRQDDFMEEKKEVSYEKEQNDSRKTFAPPPPPSPVSSAPAAPGGAPPPPSPAPSLAPKKKKTDIVRAVEDETSEEVLSLKEEVKSEKFGAIGDIQVPKQMEYNINMGLQYYNVMMERKSYLFYVYFSHKKLKIEDEEGKTVYETTIKIVTKKKEPPIMDLRIEGEGFEVHPLSGKVEVKKDAVNPPLMIFSVMPTKSGRLKKKSESERRFLNVIVEFEGELVSNSILSIIVQPKFFKLKLGPLTFNINKGTAIAISIGSIIVTILLLIYSIWSFDPYDISGVSFITGFAPSIGSLLFVVLFIYTLIKGVYPLKQQFQGLLNFDSGGIEK